MDAVAQEAVKEQWGNDVDAFLRDLHVATEREDGDKTVVPQRVANMYFAVAVDKSFDVTFGVGSMKSFVAERRPKMLLRTQERFFISVDVGGVDVKRSCVLDSATNDRWFEVCHVEKNDGSYAP